MPQAPPDDLERQRATTTFDRNVVVTAGAGTGKTTLLVQRCVNLLMREPDPVPVTELVALTFTKKAANEMKARLRDRLEALAGHGAAGAGTEEADALDQRYGLSADAVRQRAEDALRRLEWAQIGTIHGFAASLLRLYPLETGLAPQFQEDDGALRKRRFDSAWELWLDQELSGAAPRTAQWKDVLGRHPLDRLRELAFALGDEGVDLDRLGDAGSPENPASLVGEWLRDLDEAAADLKERNPEPRAEPRKIARVLATAHRVIGSVRDCDPSVEAEVEAIDAEDLEVLEGQPSLVKGWSDEDYSILKGIHKDALALARVDPDEIARVCALLTPFARLFRTECAREGIVSFDGLLVRARDLLRDHPRIREELKTRFKAILVDEFQDTDPLQYEILLWLCEDGRQRARNWREIRLSAGKLFVVGDPKQSIYGFRGADMGAFVNVVQEMILAQDGVECRLTANFRSDPRILDVVNGLFENLIREEPGLQPEYIALQPGLAVNPPAPDPSEPGGAPDGTEPVPAILRRVWSPDEKPSADEARRLEAESLACWLQEEVLGRMSFRERDGRRTPVEPGHVAFLMRALTHVKVYLEALRRRGIGYVVEGERDFYAAREVVDAISLLRAIDNPYDRLALVGVLRSPVGGCDDTEIFALSQRKLLDYRQVEGSGADELPASVSDLYGRLLRLHREARFLEAGEVVDWVFRELPLSVLAASGNSGQQAVANLEKVRLVAREAGGGGSGTLKDVVAELERRVREEEDEPENVLEEETLDAVRIMSIHRAKGLEFPVVVLPDARSGGGGREHSTTEVWQDWATGLVGIRLGNDLWNLPGAFLQSRRRRRDACEQHRVRYVAMTRPRRQLVVSFADRQRAADSTVSMIEEATGCVLPPIPASVACGAGEMALEVVAAPATDGNRGGRAAPAPDASDWSWYDELWRRRREDHEARCRTPLFLSPTGMEDADEAGKEDAGEAAEARRRKNGTGPETARVLGTLAHKVLEHWDFQTQRVHEDLDQAIARHTPELPAAQHQEVIRTLKAIWAVFTASPVYEELRGARILGREMRFVLPWDRQVMEGVIDLVYERQGRLYVADYKTDQVTGDDLTEMAHRYRHQAHVYTEAVRRGLGREVAGFRLILLRLGRAVDVPAGTGGAAP